MASYNLTVNTQNNNINYTLFVYFQTDMDEEIIQAYREKIEKHNEDILSNSYADSGFDLFVPNEVMMHPEKINKIDFKMKCEMVKYTSTTSYTTQSCGFYLYPRSSISKTNFRLANHVGIIDSGYRGSLGGMFDVIYSHMPIKCEKGTRLLQICTSTLDPFKIVIVDNDGLLSSTQRNRGGFGSTGMNHE